MVLRKHNCFHIYIFIHYLKKYLFQNETKKIGYYLDEDNNWALSVKELERAYNESLSLCEPRVICIINPGNPTGQVLSLSNMKEIIKWAYEKKLFIFADEVRLFCFVFCF